MNDKEIIIYTVSKSNKRRMAIKAHRGSFYEHACLVKDTRRKDSVKGLRTTAGFLNASFIAVPRGYVARTAGR